jgi:hypothetical protein
LSVLLLAVHPSHPSSHTTTPALPTATPPPSFSRARRAAAPARLGHARRHVVQHREHLAHHLAHHLHLHRSLVLVVLLLPVASSTLTATVCNASNALHTTSHTHLAHHDASTGPSQHRRARGLGLRSRYSSSPCGAPRCCSRSPCCSTTSTAAHSPPRCRRTPRRAPSRSPPRGIGRARSLHLPSAPRLVAPLRLSAHSAPVPPLALPRAFCAAVVRTLVPLPSMGTTLLFSFTPLLHHEHSCMLSTPILVAHRVEHHLVLRLEHLGALVAHDLASRHLPPPTRVHLAPVAATCRTRCSSARSLSRRSLTAHVALTSLACGIDNVGCFRLGCR